MDISHFASNKPLRIYDTIDKNTKQNNPYYESAIIPPPKKESINIVDKYYRYVIDSRDRNTQLYPLPSEYTIELDEDVTDVKSIELLVADIPFSRYMIHDNNNVLNFMMGDEVEKEAIIRPGNYTENELGVEVERQLNIVGNGDFSVTYEETTNKYIITNMSKFTLLFKGDPYQHTTNVFDFKYRKKTMARLLGFHNDDAESFTSGTGLWGVKSMYARNFSSERYMVMKIQQVDLNKSLNKPLQSSFCIINNPNEPISNYYDHVMKKNLSKPITSLKKLRISFYDYYGNLYDFQNHDHRLEIVFGTLKQSMLYNDVVTNNFM